MIYTLETLPTVIGMLLNSPIIRLDCGKYRIGDSIYSDFKSVLDLHINNSLGLYLRKLNSTEEQVICEGKYLVLTGHSEGTRIFAGQTNVFSSTNPIYDVHKDLRTNLFYVEGALIGDIYEVLKRKDIVLDIGMLTAEEYKIVMENSIHED